MMNSVPNLTVPGTIHGLIVDMPYGEEDADQHVYRQLRELHKRGCTHFHYENDSAKRYGSIGAQHLYTSRSSRNSRSHSASDGTGNSPLLIFRNKMLPDVLQIFFRIAKRMYQGLWFVFFDGLSQGRLFAIQMHDET